MLVLFAFVRVLRSVLFLSIPNRACRLGLSIQFCVAIRTMVLPGFALWSLVAPSFTFSFRASYVRLRGGGCVRRVQLMQFRTLFWV